MTQLLLSKENRKTLPNNISAEVLRHVAFLTEKTLSARKTRANISQLPTQDNDRAKHPPFSLSATAAEREPRRRAATAPATVPFGRLGARREAASSAPRPRSWPAHRTCLPAPPPATAGAHARQLGQRARPKRRAVLAPQSPPLTRVCA